MLCAALLADWLYRDAALLRTNSLCLVCQMFTPTLYLQSVLTVTVTDAASAQGGERAGPDSPKMAFTYFHYRNYSRYQMFQVSRAIKNKPRSFMIIIFI